MAKFPMYEQQTSVGSVRASAQDFGAGVGQAVTQAGDMVNDLGMHIKRRQDVIERVQLMGELDKYAQDSLTAVNDTEDISQQATVEKYSAGLREKAGEIVKRHGGTGQSRAELQAQIENQVGQYIKSATATQVKAQQQFIGTMVDQKANELAIKGAFAPNKIGDIFTDLDRTIDMMGDALSPTLSAQYKEAGRSRIATSAIQQLLVQGQAGTAKALLQNPEIGKYLNADSSRKFAIDITVDERKNELETQRVEKNVASWGQRLGRNLTPEEVIKVRSMPEKKDMTVADQIVEYELITGKPAPQSVVDQFYKVDGPGSGASMFGNSLQGRALSFVTENAVAYANGLLTPDQARMYEVSVAEAYKPVERVNPLSGLVEKFTPTIPNFVRDATERGGRSYGGGSLTSQASSGSAMPGQTVQLTDSTGRVIGRSVVGPDGMWTIHDQNPQAAQPPGGGGGGASPMTTSQQGSTPETRTIWQRRENIVGPVAGTRSAINSVPGVGPAVAGAVFGGEETRQADADRAYVENTSRDLVRVLQNNPRFAEGERKSIEKEISIGPEFFKSVESFEGKLIGINQSLQDRLVDAQRTVQSNVSLEERKRAMDNINAIENFRQKMGLPVPVKSEEDVRLLPPGTLFMDPKGNEFRKR